MDIIDPSAVRALQNDRLRKAISARRAAEADRTGGASRYATALVRRLAGMRPRRLARPYTIREVPLPQ